MIVRSLQGNLFIIKETEAKLFAVLRFFKTTQMKVTREYLKEDVFNNIYPNTFDQNFYLIIKIAIVVLMLLCSSYIQGLHSEWRRNIDSKTFLSCNKFNLSYFATTYFPVFCQRSFIFIPLKTMKEMCI